MRRRETSRSTRPGPNRRQNETLRTCEKVARSRYQGVTAHSPSQMIRQPNTIALHVAKRRRNSRRAVSYFFGLTLCGHLQYRYCMYYLPLCFYICESAKVRKSGCHHPCSRCNASHHQRGSRRTRTALGRPWLFLRTRDGRLSSGTPVITKLQNESWNLVLIGKT
ncbi:hypothetical protein BZA70DRAFT_201212 [Myxozyma melibiosi]|uniref:Uncharacterized protein n=1 Tax=Myxozyma melibiosi TaxID=54550 RepID=A0ABR1F2P5_9ASCO